MDDNPQSWLEVSMNVDGELAEAVADVFARFAPSGVVIESTEIEDEIDAQGKISGLLRVSAYIEINESLENKKQKLEESLWYLGKIQPLPNVQFKTIQEENWMHNWKEHFNPVAIGRKFVIVPIWHTNPHPERIEIKMNPGMAFGTGTHPTTQLSLTLLEKHLKKDDTVFDIGFGSGILSIGAIKLGAKIAYGSDIDASAIAVAEEIAKINSVNSQVQFKKASIEQIQQKIFATNKADVVIANILAHILIKLLGEGMGDLIKSGGILLLSGILDIKLEEIKIILSTHGFEITELIFEKDWVGLAAKRI